MATLRPLLAEVAGGTVKQYGSIEHSYANSERTKPSNADAPTVNTAPEAGRTHPNGNGGNGTFSQIPSNNKLGPRPRVIRSPPRIPLMIREIWDMNVRQSTDWALANACFGVGVMILLNEIPSYLPQWVELGMQTSLSITTCVLLYQLFELKWYQRRIRLAELVTKRRKVLPIHKGGKDEKSIAAKYPLPHLRKWALFKQCCLEPEFWLMNLVYAIHLPPALWVEIPPKFGLLMFLRLWILFDALRMHSDVYKQRHVNKTLLPDTRIIYSRGVALRTFIYERPISFALLSVAGSITIFGYCIHVLERADPNYTFVAALWVSAESVLFMWPADVYEDYNPNTWAGRFVAIITSMVGLAITAFCVGATFDQILSTPQERKLVLWIRYASIRKQEVDRAARLIQYVMRTYLHEEKLKKQYEESDPEKLEQLLDAIDDEWYDIVALHSSDLRRLRMDRIDLEVEWRKYSPEPIPSWQLDIFGKEGGVGKAGPPEQAREPEADFLHPPLVSPRQREPAELADNKGAGLGEPTPTRRDPYVTPDHYRERDVVAKLNLLQARMDDLSSELRGISLALTGSSSTRASGASRSSGSGGAYSRGSCSVVTRRTPEPAPRGRTVQTPRSSAYTSSGNAKHWDSQAKHWDTGYYSSS